jgi:hypothetical protein
VNHDLIEQVLRDYGALRRPGTDPELEAVRAAILFEDIFGVTLSDAEIDEAALAGPSALAALAARFSGSA